MNNSVTFGSSSVARENASFMSRVYGWMTFGVFITAAVSTYIAGNPDLFAALLQNRNLFLFLFLAQLGVVIGLTAALQRLSVMAATLLYLGYSALTGVTLSVIFYAYTADSIAQVFGTTAVAFAGLSLFGFTTKKDLGPVGSFCGMALFGMIGFALLSFFVPGFRSDTAQVWYSAIGVVVFAGLTAYDTQRIKAMRYSASSGDMDRKLAIYGALALYLDFINLFLMLLRLSGRRK